MFIYALDNVLFPEGKIFQVDVPTPWHAGEQLKSSFPTAYWMIMCWPDLRVSSAVHILSNDREGLNKYKTRLKEEVANGNVTILPLTE